MLEDLQELPLRLLINDELYTEFICTPDHIQELIIGMLVSNGKVTSLEDFADIRYDADTAEVNVSAKLSFPETQESFSQAVMTALQSHDTTCAAASAKELPSDIMDQIRVLGQQMQQMRTSGLHGAMIFGNEKTVFCQDISRHCAVDKAIGSSIKSGIVLPSSILLTTGRISSELLWKAKMLHIPIIASLKYPSRTGEITASAWGITLACNILTQEASILLPK